MPTHQDFPDSYFEDPADGDQLQLFDQAPVSQGLGTGTKLLAVVTVLMVAVAAYPLWGRLFASSLTSPRAAASAKMPPAPGPASAPAASRAGATSSRGVLAVGTSMPGTGRPPHLEALDSAGPDAVLVTIRSSSRAPVSISVSGGPGEPVKHWRTLRLGDSNDESVVTGHRYGYCFTQAAAEGYAPSRACGTLITHRLLNGVRLPDGGVSTTEFRFAGR